MSEELDQGGQLVVRVQSARAGQHPDFGACQAVGLQPERRLGATERGTVRAQSDECHRARPITADFGSKLVCAESQFGRRELVRRGGGAVHQVGQAVAELEELDVLRRVEKARREARGMQRRPEAVAGTSEVKTGGCRVQAGVDAAEQHLQAGPDDVAQPLAARRCQVRRTRSMTPVAPA